MLLLRSLRHLYYQLQIVVWENVCIFESAFAKVSHQWLRLMLTILFAHFAKSKTFSPANKSSFNLHYYRYEQQSLSMMFLPPICYRYVALSDNEQTDYKARELKSVHVDSVGTYLKLVIHKNHVNKYNLYNQVSSCVVVCSYSKVLLLQWVYFSFI